MFIKISVAISVENLSVYSGTIHLGRSNKTSVYPAPGLLLSGEPDYFGRNKISSGGDLSHYSSASLY